MPAILEDDSLLKGFMCSSQVGKTTMGISIVYHYADTAGSPRRVIYTMHTDKAVESFAQTRATSSIQASPYLSARIGDVNNVHRKVFRRPDGNSVIMFAGASKSAMGLSEPADMVVHDEVDFSNPEVLRLYEDRTAHGYEEDKRRLLFGTPTIPGFGLSRYWDMSTQNEWLVKCPQCGDERPVAWPDSFAHDATPEPYFICGRGHKLTWADNIREGRWVASQPGGDWSMYRIARWQTPFWGAPRIVKAYSTETFLQLFYNQVCGQQATSGELTIDEEVLSNCVDQERLEAEIAAGGRVFLGADPGRVISWVVGVERANDTRVYLAAGEADGWAELEAVMRTYRVRLAVVDGAYDPTAAQAFAKKFKRRVLLTYYAKTPLKGEPIRESKTKGYLDLDRTVTLDRSANRLIMGLDRFPRFPDLHQWERFVSQMTAMVRAVREEDDGTRVFFWQEVRPDHWRHAHNYATVAADIMQGKTGVPIPESLQKMLGTSGERMVAVEQATGKPQAIVVEKVDANQIENIQNAPMHNATGQRPGTLAEEMYPALKMMREMIQSGTAPQPKKKEEDA
jgi:hypothetical protein